MATVLVVDDDDLVRSTLRVILERAGHDVHEAANGQMATSFFRDKRPDVVITDIYMPEKDGLEVVMELRRIQPDVKIIAISGGGPNVETGLLGSAQIFGAKRTLFKPILPDVLLATVDEVLAGA